MKSYNYNIVLSSKNINVTKQPLKSYVIHIIYRHLSLYVETRKGDINTRIWVSEHMEMEKVKKYDII